MDVKAHTKASRDVGMVRVRVGLNYSQSHASTAKTNVADLTRWTSVHLTKPHPHHEMPSYGFSDPLHGGSVYSH